MFTLNEEIKKEKHSYLHHRGETNNGFDSSCKILFLLMNELILLYRARSSIFLTSMNKYIGLKLWTGSVSPWLFMSASGATTRNLPPVLPCSTGHHLLFCTYVQTMPSSFYGPPPRYPPNLSSKPILLNISTLSTRSRSDRPHIRIVILLLELCCIFSSLWVRAHDAAP